MKAYASVHLPKLLVTFLAISLFVLVIWLNGYRNYLVIGYGLLLFGLFIVLVYLVDYLPILRFISISSMEERHTEAMATFQAMAQAVRCP